MRAQKVNEVQGFHRGTDPKTAMKLGNPIIQEIKSSVDFFQDILSSGFLKDKFNFVDAANLIQVLPKVNLIVAKVFLENKFGWQFIPDSETGGLRYDSGDLTVKLFHSESYKAIYLRIYKNGKTLLKLMPANDLAFLEKQALKLVEKFKL